MANVAADKIATCVIFPRTLKAEAQQYAKEIGEPMGTIVRLALAEYLKTRRADENQQVAA